MLCTMTGSPQYQAMVQTHLLNGLLCSNTLVRTPLTLMATLMVMSFFLISIRTGSRKRNVNNGSMILLALVLFRLRLLMRKRLRCYFLRPQLLRCPPLCCQRLNPRRQREHRLFQREPSNQTPALVLSLLSLRGSMFLLRLPLLFLLIALHRHLLRVLLRLLHNLTLLRFHRRNRLRSDRPCRLLPNRTKVTFPQPILLRRGFVRDPRVHLQLDVNDKRFRLSEPVLDELSSLVVSLIHLA